MVIILANVPVGMEPLVCVTCISVPLGIMPKGATDQLGATLVTGIGKLLLIKKLVIVPAGVLFRIVILKQQLSKPNGPKCEAKTSKESQLVLLLQAGRSTH